MFKLTHGARMKKVLPIALCFLLLLSACSQATKTTTKTRNVFYAGGNNGVKAALLQSGYKLVDDFRKADVFVLNGEIPDVDAIASRLQNGAGLVLIIGEETSFRDVETLFDYPVSALISARNPVSLAVDKDFGKNDILSTEINWNDAPQIRERAAILTSAPGKPLIRVSGNAEVFLGEIGQPSEKKFFINAILDEYHNLQFQEWKYFNYLIYHLVERAAGAEPMTFVEYSTQKR